MDRESDDIGPDLPDSPIASKTGTLNRSSRLPLPSLDMNKSMTSKSPRRLVPPPRSLNATTLLPHHHDTTSSSRLSSPYSPSPASPLRQSPGRSQRGSPSAQRFGDTFNDMEMLDDASKSQLHLPASAPGSPTRRKAKEGNVRVIVRYTYWFFSSMPQN